MRRLTLSLKALAIILFAGALIAWFSDPSRKVDWFPLFVIAVVVSIVDVRLMDLEKRLKALEGSSGK